MPNWVANCLRFHGSADDMAQIDVFFKGGIDFNDFIHMPEELNMVEGSNTTTAILAYLTDYGRKNLAEGAGIGAQHSGNMFFDDATLKRFYEHVPSPSDQYDFASRSGDKLLMTYAEAGKRYVDNLEKHGAATWYGWCTENWGTKWNACDASWDGETLVFQTAWDAPWPIIDAVAQRFCSVDILHEWADEDEAPYCGAAEYRGGERISTVIYSGEEGIKAADRIWESFWRESDQAEAEISLDGESDDARSAREAINSGCDVAAHVTVDHRENR